MHKLMLILLVSVLIVSPIPLQAQTSEPEGTMKTLFQHNPDAVASISVDELQGKLKAKTPIFILDVREPSEHEEDAIPGSFLVPLGSLPARYTEVPRDVMVVVYCRSGMRSSRGTAFLREKGYANAWNLKGGMMAWEAKKKTP
jgi:rhodanese-related sulfurtransferase